MQLTSVEFRNNQYVARDGRELGMIEPWSPPFMQISSLDVDLTDDSEVSLSQIKKREKRILETLMYADIDAKKRNFFRESNLRSMRMDEIFYQISAPVHLGKQFAVAAQFYTPEVELSTLFAKMNSYKIVCGEVITRAIAPPNSFLFGRPILLEYQDNWENEIEEVIGRENLARVRGVMKPFSTLRVRDRNFAPIQLLQVKDQNRGQIDVPTREFPDTALV